jgi:hypothetical protein
MGTQHKRSSLVDRVRLARVLDLAQRMQTGSARQEVPKADPRSRVNSRGQVADILGHLWCSGVNSGFPLLRRG